MCALCRECCLTGFSSRGFVGWVNGQLKKRVGLPGFCSEMSFPSLWKDCMKKSLCGVSREGLLRGLRRFMVVFIGPYLCLFWRIGKAYAEVGLLFLKGTSRFSPISFLY